MTTFCIAFYKSNLSMLKINKHLQEPNDLVILLEVRILKDSLWKPNFTLDYSRMRGSVLYREEKNDFKKNLICSFRLSLGELSDVDSTKFIDYLTIYSPQSICRLFLKIDLKFFFRH